MSDYLQHATNPGGGGSDPRHLRNLIPSLGYKAEKAAQGLGVKKGSYDNPTASGSGMTGKERANHKYIDKVKTKSGKTRYIYDVTTASGSHNGPDPRARAKANLKMAQRDSPRRNTGSTRELRRGIAADKIAKRASRAPGEAASRVGKAVSDGAKWLNDRAYDAVMSTPLKELFT